MTAYRLTRLGLHVLVPATLGPVADPTVEAKAWTYWMTVSGEQGADLMLIRPSGETQHLTLHVTTLLAPSPPRRRKSAAKRAAPLKA